MQERSFPFVRAGVKALIVHKGKILMIQERIDDLVIHDFPGGGIEYGESITEALHREVMEEVGLKITIERPLGNWWFINRETVHIVSMGYQCTLVGEPIIDTEHNPAEEDIFNAVWLTKEEILTNANILLKAQGMKAVVKNLKI